MVGRVGAVQSTALCALPQLRPLQCMLASAGEPCISFASTWAQAVHRGHASLTYWEIEDEKGVDPWYMLDGKQGLRKVLCPCLCKSQKKSAVYCSFECFENKELTFDNSQATCHLVVEVRSRVVSAVLTNTILLLFLLSSQGSSRQHCPCTFSRPPCSMVDSCRRYERNG